MSIAGRNTIYALSSGSPPAAIAVVRISGPEAGAAIEALAGRLPEPRRASAATLSHPQTGEVLDRGLVLYFDGPATATGEDIGELHLHGGRSVVAGVLAALAVRPGLRAAQAGEFTRRAFENGRIDLAEAEGLADLLAAETDSQRRAALALAGGALSRLIEAWQRSLLAASGQLEATIDHSDEGDVVTQTSERWTHSLRDITKQVHTLLSRADNTMLKDGIRVVIGGPPNSGKSTLLNNLIGREAAITSPTPGTTRDVVEAPIAIRGVPFVFVDTAGLRESDAEIEAIGIARARSHLAAADIILWLGDRSDAPEPVRSIVVHSKVDITPPDRSADFNLSGLTGEGVDELLSALTARAADLLPREGEVAINHRHRQALAQCLEHLNEAASVDDPLIAAEALRQARGALDRVTGRAGVEDMLDALFTNFCIGK